jgi:uncharacterized protein (DUF362 family)
MKSYQLTLLKVTSMSMVSLVKIPRDAQAPHKEAIVQSLKLINYNFNSNHRKIVIKPNLCYYWDWTTGQTTEPKFVAALIDLIMDQIPDADISIVESDASAMRCKYVYRMLGYEKLAEEKNVPLINLSDAESDIEDVACNGKNYKFTVPKIIKEADLRINIAHIKYTVDPVKLTCALKNIYGCNPFRNKFKYHSDLGNVIVALNKVMKFDLCLIDNNIAAGIQPCKMGLVMASQDPVALDTAAAKIAWLDPYKIPYLAVAEREGVGKRAYLTRGEQLEYFKAMYPKRSFNMKMKAQAYKMVVKSGLGPRLGIE